MFSTGDSMVATLKLYFSFSKSWVFLNSWRGFMFGTFALRLWVGSKFTPMPLEVHNLAAGIIEWGKTRGILTGSSDFTSECHCSVSWSRCWVIHLTGFIEGRHVIQTFTRWIMFQLRDTNNMFTDSHGWFIHSFFHEVIFCRSLLLISRCSRFLYLGALSVRDLPLCLCETVNSWSHTYFWCWTSQFDDMSTVCVIAGVLN